MDIYKQDQLIMEKTKYSNSDLLEFKTKIEKRLESVNEQCDYLRVSVNKGDSNGTDDTSWSTKMLEDGAEALTKEELNMMYQKQLSLKRDLMDALYRIEIKSYGICDLTGELIPKERLMAMPTAKTIIKKK